MPKVEIDYSNTIFYKLSCIDQTIYDMYVGYTTNFVQRKHSHKQRCLNNKNPNYNSNVYTTIRNCGGWENWKMDILAVHNCADLSIARKITQKYIEEYNATLNNAEPLPNTIINTYNSGSDNDQQISLTNMYNTDHMTTNMIIEPKVATLNKKSQKVADYFECISCLYSCSKKSDWVKHLSTRKHKNRTKLNDIEQNGEFVADTSFGCECGKHYVARNSLWYHRKSCYIYQSIVSTTLPDEQHYNSNTQLDDNVPSNSQLVATSMKDKDIEFKELILLLLKENKEIQKTFVEILPHIKGNAEHSFNTTTTNNTNTNNFNIQMFLNEQCKNAMNLTDFIDSLPITNETYDHTIENGLTKTITHMITDGLNNMDVMERPIHCTDPTRKIMYVKDNNVWEKDNELKSILQGIKSLSLKQRTKISKWQDVNIGWDKDDNLQTRLTTLVFHSMTDIANDEKEMNKIIRAIGKTTHLTSQLKNELLLIHSN